MHIIRPARFGSKRAQHAKGKSRLNLYPLLGILLVIVFAALTYGGLYFFLS